MANTFITRTPSSAGNKKTFTLSVWVKRTTLGSDYILTARNGTGSLDAFYFGFRNNQIQIDSTASGGDKALTFRSNALYRDTFGWYNIILAVDTTQSTASDRAKLYVNGSQITSFEISTYPDQNDDFYGINDTIVHSFGREHFASGTAYHEYLLSHIHFIDGTAYDASTFGETDATTGEWKIKTSPSVTYGTNGFFILKDGNSVTDQSGNGNNFTVGGGTLTNTEDCPSNVFATLNPLVYESRDNTFSNGNNTITGGGSDDWTNKYGTSTIAPSSGKYYVEAKLITKVNSQAIIGLISTSQAISGSLKDFGVFALETEGRLVGSGSNIQTGLTAFSNGDIAGLAFDATNGTAQFYRNGSTYGNPLSSIPSDTYYFATTTYYTGGVINFNFGNGYFGTTAVASAGTNASGNGIFEYDVPTGYTALSTKGLNL